MRKLILLLAVFVFSAPIAAAESEDDGFVWVDANTKIRVKPIGKAAGSAATGSTQAPEPKTKEKQEKPKK